ncbi:unnamed protein product [Closterium sp. NIES-65]|nr:unnamed protein product [Closterium sp. NIES-65]
MSYDEVEIEDMEWNEELGAFTYSCPCGDLFQITLEELKNGEEIARCPSCSLFITVIYNSEDFQGDGPGKVQPVFAYGATGRSHAVLQIDVKRVVSSRSAERVMGAKLCLVDLAGSERASETNNMGQQLRDGANINKSLLALSNCINALCQQQKRGVGYVPYRNSKLTRLLKDGLSGNSRTTMVATICPAADQYHHIINTLKYADRAKEIKTRIRTNVRTVDSQSSDYLRMIEKLQEEVSMLKGQLAEQAATSSMNPVAHPSGTSWLDDISRQLNENVQERINMQKAMCELNECLKRAGDEVCRLDQKIAILQDINNNEAERELLQKRLDSFVNNHENSSFLHILNQFRFLSVEMTEMQFQLALRDQLIAEKTSAMNSLWMLLQASDVDIEELLDAAVQKGVPLDSSLSSYIDVKLKEAIATPNGSPKFALSCGAAGRAVWNHRFNFLLPDREQDYPPEMDVHIWDKVNGQDKYMGFCKVHLEQVYLRQSMDAVWPASAFGAAPPASSAAASTADGGNRSAAQPPSTPDALAAEVLSKGWDLSAIASLTSAVLSASGKGIPQGKNSTSSVAAAAAGTRPGGVSASSAAASGTPGARAGTGANRQAIMNQELIAEALCMALLGEAGRAEPARKQGKSAGPGAAGLNGSKRIWELQEEKRGEVGVGAGIGADDVEDEGPKRQRVA